MNIIKPSVELHFPGEWGNVLEHIEHCARICYKSEWKIEPGSAAKFVSMLVRRGHLAAIEHYRFVLVIPYSVRDILSHEYLITNNQTYRAAAQTVIASEWNPMFCIMSCNARNLIEMRDNSYSRTHDTIDAIMGAIAHIHPEVLGVLFPESVLDSWHDNDMGIGAIENNMMRTLLNEDQMTIHGWFTSHIITDRGIGNEIVRHRPASYCQESTRYCNYSGNGIEFIKPSNIDEYKTPLWLTAMHDAEEAYMQLTDDKAAPQTARGVLPLNTKTELCMTATYSEWNHFIALRSGMAAHPDIRPIAESIDKQYSAKLLNN